MTTNKSVEEIVNEFDSKYFCEWRWKNERMNNPNACDFLRQALTSHTNTVLRQQLEEILVIVQEDIDFGAKHQQIVSTKAQAKILTLLSLLNDQIISNEEKI